MFVLTLCNWCVLVCKKIFLDPQLRPSYGNGSPGFPEMCTELLRNTEIDILPPQGAPRAQGCDTLLRDQKGRNSSSRGIAYPAHALCQPKQYNKAHKVKKHSSECQNQWTKKGVSGSKPNWWPLACSPSSGNIYFDTDDRTSRQKIEI